MNQEELFAKITTENVEKMERMIAREDLTMEQNILKMQMCEHEIESTVVHDTIAVHDRLTRYENSVNMFCDVIVSMYCKKCGTHWTTTGSIATAMWDK